MAAPLHRVVGVRSLLPPEGARRATTGPANLPFETWAYSPPYLPPELHIDVAAGTTSNEPMLFVIPFGRRPDAAPAGRRQPLDHPGGFGEITALRIELPQPEPISHAARALHDAGLVSFGAGDDHLAEIEFDHGNLGRSADLRPALPLRFRW